MTPGNFKSAGQVNAHSLSITAALFCLLLITWFIYQPAIPGLFLMDDYDNLVSLNSTTAIDLIEKGNAGPLGRPISKLSFFIDDNAWPSKPDSFKRTNLLIHLLIGVILFSFSRILLRPFFSVKQCNWLALTATALWLVHPFHMSTVSYVVQRMTQLASLFMIIGITAHLYIRTRYQNLEFRHLVWLSLSLGFFGLLAAFSKENGVLLPVYITVIELTLLSQITSSKHFIWWRRIFILTPTLGLTGYLLSLFWTASYSNRDFTLLERVLTQPVVLVDYLSNIFSLRVRGLGLIHDDFPIYTSLFQPQVLFSITLLLAAFIAAIKYRKRYPLIAFGVLWFFAGHLLESTTLWLEIYFEHRNYLPLFGPVFALVIFFYSGLKRVSVDAAKFSPVAAILTVIMASTATWGYATDWGDPYRLFPIWAAEHPNSARAQRIYAHALISGGLTSQSLDVLDDAYKQFPKDLSLPIMSIDFSCRFDAPLRYNFAELATRIHEHKVTDGLRPALQSMFKGIYKHTCKNIVADLHAFTASIERINNGKVSNRWLAGIYVLDGNLYLEEGNGTEALQSYLAIDKLEPTTDSILRITNIYIRVKDYDRARQALKAAQERDIKATPWYRSPRTKEYDEKFAFIDKLETAILLTPPDK